MLNRGRLSFLQIWKAAEAYCRNARIGQVRMCRAAGCSTLTGWILLKTIRSMNVLNAQRDELIRQLLSSGKGVREVARITGHDKNTVAARTNQKLGKPKRAKPGHNRCDNCGAKIEGEREFYRRTRRTKHKFCSHDCYGEFYKRARKHDKCQRCGVERGTDLRSMLFVKGMCGTCYNLLRLFGFNEEAAAAHEALQQLRKEIRHGKVNRYHYPKHKRPAFHAHRHD